MSNPRYQLLEPLGHGEFADVHRARVHRASIGPAFVAIKVLKPEAARRDATLEDFFAEAHLVQQLHHPGVVQMLDYGEFEGRPFQVLELIDGPSIATALQRGRIPDTDVALLWIRQVCEALDYVHHAVDADGTPLRIVHRDITPGNLLLTRDGRVKVADFGISRAFRRRRMTAVGTVRGTLEYMAPEQFRAEPLDGRSDLFAVGCVLHTLLFGHSPLASPEVRDALIAGEPLTFEAVPDEIRSILARALAPWQRDRFVRAQHFAAACAALLDHRTMDTVQRRAADWVRRPEVLDVSTRTDSAVRASRWLSRMDGPTRVFVELPTLDAADDDDDDDATLLEEPLEPPTLDLGTGPTLVGTAQARPLTVPVRPVGPTLSSAPRPSDPPAWVQWSLLTVLAIGSAVVFWAVLGWVTR